MGAPRLLHHITTNSQKPLSQLKAIALIKQLTQRERNTSLNSPIQREYTGPDTTLDVVKHPGKVNAQEEH
jgi:hypothetical protein